MTERKLRVALFMGGRSEEREVSLNTGKMIARHLDKIKYEVLPLEIASDGRWLLDSPALREIEQAGQARIDQALIRSISPASISMDRKVDVVFLALHGPYGEDGTIQGMLELLGIPYTCSGVLASALAMDKFRMKAFARGLGIRVAGDMLVYPADFARDREGILRQIAGLGNKVVIKPNRLGSSVATFIPEVPAGLESALQSVFELGHEALVEEFVPGIEVTAPVLGNSDPEVLPLIEIIPNRGAFYDYESKYAEGGSDHIIPAGISEELTVQIQQQAVKIHQQLGCRGITRSDFIVNGQDAYFLEINTIPGMTATSLAPQSAQVAGYSFPEFLDRLIELALVKD